MLSAEDNELLCRVGPGTPMGELMRRYWVPAIASRELIADGEPVRLMLLGEKLIAFRDTNGKVGVMDHECPHRLASLFYGRNEEGGIRCIYHGWKFDTEGNCLDMANVPPHQDFKANVKAGAYKARERGGIVWAYMGPGEAPDLPAISNTMHSEEDVVIQSMQRECNWLQTLEGDIDTSHAGFLHGGFVKNDFYAPDDPVRFTYNDKTPDYQVEDTDWGVMYGAHRPADNGNTYWRIAHYVFPFWSLTPAQPFDAQVGMNARVPMDDYHTMSIQIRRKGAVIIPANPPPDRIFPKPDEVYRPNTTDWFGRWRLSPHAGNDHLIDRERQRTVSFSGMIGVPQQDSAVTESMGPIANRTKEHLAYSDRMIQVTRRRMLDAVKKFRDEGGTPPLAGEPNAYAGIESGYFISPETKLWDAYKMQSATLAKKSPAPAK